MKSVRGLLLLTLLKMTPYLKVEWILRLYPPVSEASREVANLTETKNPHTPVYGVKEFVRLSLFFVYCGLFYCCDHLRIWLESIAAIEKAAINKK